MLLPLYRLAQPSAIWQKKGRLESGLSLGRKRPTRAKQQSLAAMQKIMDALADATSKRASIRNPSILPDSCCSPATLGRSDGPPGDGMAHAAPDRSGRALGRKSGGWNLPLLGGAGRLLALCRFGNAAGRVRRHGGIIAGVTRRNGSFPGFPEITLVGHDFTSPCFSSTNPIRE